MIIAPEAEQDITEAYAWYEGRRMGLEEEFLSCVEACIEAIFRAPGMQIGVHENYGPAMNASARYVKIVEWSDEDQGFVGSCPGLFFGGTRGHE